MWGSHLPALPHPLVAGLDGVQILPRENVVLLALLYMGTNTHKKNKYKLERLAQQRSIPRVE